MVPPRDNLATISGLRATRHDDRDNEVMTVVHFGSYASGVSSVGTYEVARLASVLVERPVLGVRT